MSQIIKNRKAERMPSKYGDGAVLRNITIMGGIILVRSKSPAALLRSAKLVNCIIQHEPAKRKRRKARSGK